MKNTTNQISHNYAQVTFKESGTPESTRFEDFYYNVNNGLAETNHIFLQGNNIPQRLQAGEALHIGETGFGTGLNFLATWKAWQDAGMKQPLTFTSCEKFPLTEADFNKAQAPWTELSPISQKLIDAYPRILKGEAVNFEGGLITLDVRLKDVLDAFVNIKDINTWYLDGFSPKKNPDMWTQNLFNLMSNSSAQKATGATFSAAKFIREGLSEAGFNVTRTKGFAYKRHMVTFCKKSLEKAASK